MYGTLRDSQYGYSLFDFNVYGPPAPLALTGPTYLEMDSTVAGQVDAWAGITNTGNPTQTYMLSQITTIIEKVTMTCIRTDSMFLLRTRPP